MLVEVREGSGRLQFTEDRIISIPGTRAPSLSDLECVIVGERGAEGSPEVWKYLDWARGQVPYEVGQQYTCSDFTHAALVCFALCAALEYHDPRYHGRLHGWTRDRLVRIGGPRP